ncbi:hypothetical protein N665_1522s0002 [Sinapis alba]|nr:hypothetical protein N665_1522s0002 [Sinapis alba]
MARNHTSHISISFFFGCFTTSLSFSLDLYLPQSPPPPHDLRLFAVPASQPPPHDLCSFAIPASPPSQNHGMEEARQGRHGGWRRKMTASDSRGGS